MKPLYYGKNGNYGKQIRGVKGAEVVSPPEAIATLESARAAAAEAAAAYTYRTKSAAILVKPDAVGEWNYWCDLLADGRIDEETHGEAILERVRRRDGMVSIWESIEVEPTGQRDGYLVEVKILQTEETWWTSEDYIMRVQRP